MDAAKRGATALDAGKYEEAIKEYTSALSQMPNAVDYYLKRSTAYQRSSPPDFEAALKDADLATHLAYKRARRELIGQAQLRRAILLFNTGKYADASYILGFVKKYDEKNKTLSIWDTKIAGKLKSLAEDDENKIVKAKENPEVELPSEKKASKPVADSTTSTTGSSTTTAIQTPPSQIKHDWYQNRENVYFTLLAKGVPKDKAHIEIEQHSITISFPTQTGSDYDFSLDPLFAPINASSSTFNITPTKIELVLKKELPGQQWKSLEGTGHSAAAIPSTNLPDQAIKNAVLKSDSAPAYPTSSRKGPKNWDKVVDDITKKPKGGDDGGDDDEYEDHGGDEANFFFKKLYAGADEDTKRAMMKSYMESNGTVLSTNWAEVGKGKVETSPPDGMEAKNWGS